MHFGAPETIHAGAAEVFELERARVRGVLPQAGVEHVGATAVTGAWSKGDVDLLVRVRPDDLAAAVEALRGVYADHQLDNWNATFASFAAPARAVGVQLVAAGSADDLAFVRFRERLSSEPALLAEYNELKRRHEGAAEDDYRAAKAAFVQRVVD